tara:strand:- start:496 stop:1341 length:846 start_codon:yes stop_codon:yes gene_type:complete
VSTCVEKLPCPDCGSSDSLQSYLNGDTDLGIEWYTAFCHGKCWEQKGDPYAGKSAPVVHVRTQEEIQEAANDVLGCKAFAPERKYRGIPPRYYKSWKMRVLLSEFDGVTPYAMAFPFSDGGKLKGWKARPFRKKDFFAIGTTAGCDPFGFERARRIGGKILLVTEGEFDAIALDYCLNLAMGTDEVKYPVISLSQGGGSILKDFTKIAAFLKSYDKIILVLDDDEVGLKAEQTGLELLPDKVLIARKPTNSKDANDAVEAGMAKEMGQIALELIYDKRIPD